MSPAFQSSETSSNSKHFIPSINRSKNQGNNHSTPESSTQTPIPRTQRDNNNYFPLSEESQSEIKIRPLDQNQNFTSKFNSEKREKDDKDGRSGSASRSLPTPRDDHDSAACVMRKGVPLLEDSRIKKDREIFCASELRKTILDLSTVSNTINSRLDNTYYSILEKLSSLQSTIINLKELAAMTRNVNVRLVSECKNVAHDCNSQLDSFCNFQDQVKRITELKKRADIGRHNVLCLGERVKRVRQRVESWEMSEREWQSTTRRRCRILWRCMSAVLALAFLAYFWPWLVSVETPDEKLINHTQSPQDNGTCGNKTELGEFVNRTINRNCDVLQQINNKHNGEADDNKVPRDVDEL